MTAKGLMTMVAIAGALLLAPGVDQARADPNDGIRQDRQQLANGGGWWGYSHVHDQRGWRHYDGRLTRKDRKALKRIRARFDSERAFRRHLRHHKPRLFARYMNHLSQRHQRHYQAFDHRHRGRFSPDERRHQGSVQRHYRHNWGHAWGDYRGQRYVRSWNHRELDD